MLTLIMGLGLHIYKLQILMNFVILSNWEYAHDFSTIEQNYFFLYDREGKKINL